MFGLYRETAVLAFQRALKAWPVAFSLLLFGIVFRFAAIVAQPLGILGGFLLGLVAAACGAAYLHLLSLAVEGRPARLEDLKNGWRQLFWDVVSVMFALWIINFLVMFIVRGAGPNGPAIEAMAGIAMAFFLNPLPEMVYLTRSRSFELLLASARFMLEHPLVWLLPNLLFAAVVLAPAGALHVSQPGELLLVFDRVFSPGGIAGVFTSLPLWAAPLLLLFLHYVMVFRGLLFQGLSSGSARRRAWQVSSRR
jgi:hypothetical protein